MEGVAFLGFSVQRECPPQVQEECAQPVRHQPEVDGRGHTRGGGTYVGTAYHNKNEKGIKVGSTLKHGNCRLTLFFFGRKKFVSLH